MRNGSSSGGAKIGTSIAAGCAGARRAPSTGRSARRPTKVPSQKEEEQPAKDEGPFAAMLDEEEEEEQQQQQQKDQRI